MNERNSESTRVEKPEKLERSVGQALATSATHVLEMGAGAVVVLGAKDAYEMAKDKLRPEKTEESKIILPPGTSDE